MFVMMSCGHTCGDLPVLPAAVLLGVQDQQVSERSFRARLERRLALLLEEALQEASRRRWRRSTAVGNSSLQVNLLLLVSPLTLDM